MLFLSGIAAVRRRSEQGAARRTPRRPPHSGEGAVVIQHLRAAAETTAKDSRSRRPQGEFAARDTVLLTPTLGRR